MAGKTVSVACKLLGGLFIDGVNAEADPGMAPDEKQRILLKGANTASWSVNYGETTVNAEFFADWMARHKAHPLVRDGMIFIVEEAEVTAGVKRPVDKPA